MKKIIISLSFILFCMPMVFAQNMDAARQALYYERYEKAAQDFQNILNQDAANESAIWGATRAYVMLGQPDKARMIIDNAPADVQNDHYYKLAKGYYLLSQGNTAEAAPLFQSVIDKTRSKDASVLSAVATAHVDAKAGDATYAVELMNKAIKRDKDNAEFMVLLGDAYLKMKNGSDAYASYQNAIKENSSYAPAYYRIGEIFQSQKSADLYLDYFNKAVQADPDFSPAHYKLYSHYFYYDAAKAMEHYNKYMNNADPDVQQQYDLADLYYLNKNYAQAIEKSNAIIAANSEVKPRIYKLMGYSTAAMQDSAAALSYMHEYFAKEEDSNVISKDYAIMANLQESLGNTDSVFYYYSQAAEIETDSTLIYDYFRNLANMAKESKNWQQQAKWLGKYYTGNDKATNLDLFNWGLAHYRAEEYGQADTVFGYYTEKYPEQSFGYYWRARANTALDKEMEQGLAIPHYNALIKLMENDTANANYKNWMVEAYAYLAAYEANAEKDYAEAVDYFQKVLEVDPENENAKKYIAILEENLEKEASTGSN